MEITIIFPMSAIILSIFICILPFFYKSYPYQQFDFYYPFLSFFITESCCKLLEDVALIVYTDNNVQFSCYCMKDNEGVSCYELSDD